MNGQRDPRVSPVEAKRVFDALPGNKKWVQFDGAGHESYLAAEPEKWKQVIGGFVLPFQSQRQLKP